MLQMIDIVWSVNLVGVAICVVMFLNT